MSTVYPEYRETTPIKKLLHTLLMSLDGYVLNHRGKKPEKKSLDKKTLDASSPPIRRIVLLFDEVVSRKRLCVPRHRVGISGTVGSLFDEVVSLKRLCVPRHRDCR
jgi:hypothetical protein